MLWEASRGIGSYDQQEQNIALLYMEVAAASILTAAVNFNSAFALRLGASNVLIGLMTSIPALITMLGMIPASAMVERRSQRWPLLLRSLLITRILIFPVVIIPWVVPHQYQAVAFVTLLCIRFIPILPFSAGFDSALADLVPPWLRAQVFSWRSILATAAVIVSLMAIRPWLELVVFPLNYQVVYLVGGLGGLLSQRWLSRIRVPESVPNVPRSARQAVSLRDMRRLIAERPDFRKMLINSLVANAGAYLAGPLYILYYVRQLNASDGWIASMTLAANVAAIVGLMVWRRLLPRLGESLTLRTTFPIAGLLPLAIALTQSLDAVILVVVINGLVTPGLNLSHYNTLLEVSPQERRPTYISLYTSLNNALAFVLPLVSVAAADVIGIGPVLIAASVILVGGGLLFTFNRVTAPDSSRAEADAA